jgi:hypothetical protein
MQRILPPIYADYARKYLGRFVRPFDEAGPHRAFLRIAADLEKVDRWLI